MANEVPSSPPREGLIQRLNAIADLVDFSGRVAGYLSEEDVKALRAAALALQGPQEGLRESGYMEICRRIEAPLPEGVETHRELAAHRKRLLDTVYAIAENALALQGPQEGTSPANATLCEIEGAHTWQMTVDADPERGDRCACGQKQWGVVQGESRPQADTKMQGDGLLGNTDMGKSSDPPSTSGDRNNS